MLRLIPHTKRGFYCNDPAIGHKFRGDTITYKVILYMGIAPLFLMWLTEAITYKPNFMKPDETRFQNSCIRSFLWFREYLVAVTIHVFVLYTLKVN